MALQHDHQHLEEIKAPQGLWFSSISPFPSPDVIWSTAPYLTPAHVHTNTKSHAHVISVVLFPPTTLNPHSVLDNITAALIALWGHPNAHVHGHTLIWWWWLISHVFYIPVSDSCIDLVVLLESSSYSCLPQFIRHLCLYVVLAHSADQQLQCRLRTLQRDYMQHLAKEFLTILQEELDKTTMEKDVWDFVWTPVALTRSGSLAGNR